MPKGTKSVRGVPSGLNTRAADDPTSLPTTNSCGVTGGGGGVGATVTGTLAVGAPVAASAAVTVCVPLVRSVMGNEPAPLERAVFGGREARVSDEVTRTNPVYPSATLPNVSN